MDLDERHKLFRQIMWDYNISASDIDAILSGKRSPVGPPSKTERRLKQ